MLQLRRRLRLLCVYRPVRLHAAVNEVVAHMCVQRTQCQWSAKQMIEFQLIYDPECCLVTHNASVEMTHEWAGALGIGHGRMQRE